MKTQKQIAPQRAAQARAPKTGGPLQRAADSSPASESLTELQLMADARPTVQRAEDDEVQAKFIQRAEAPAPKTNNTGLPDSLKSGIENLSGMSMDHVRVHRNSDKPAAVQAHAYAQGSNIHLAPGQEKHLPHEAWHVVQQAQGRVKPTMQMKGVAVNDDAGLEHEADVMGIRALQVAHAPIAQQIQRLRRTAAPEPTAQRILQRKVIVRIRTTRPEASSSTDLGRLISNIRIEGRAPTDAGPDERGNYPQGDHTVAETLINESVIREVHGQRPRLALNNLTVLAHTTLPADAAATIQGIYDTYFSTMDEMEGEDQNMVIEETIQRYIELANKRPGTAFLRSKQETRGNSGERAAIGHVREGADAYEPGVELSLVESIHLSAALTELIDRKYRPEIEDNYIATVARALRHLIVSVYYGLPRNSIIDVIFRLGTELNKRDRLTDHAGALGRIRTSLWKEFGVE